MQSITSPSIIARRMSPSPDWVDDIDPLASTTPAVPVVDSAQRLVGRWPAFQYQPAISSLHNSGQQGGFYNRKLLLEKPLEVLNVPRQRLHRLIERNLRHEVRAVRYAAAFTRH